MTAPRVLEFEGGEVHIQFSKIIAQGKYIGDFYWARSTFGALYDFLTYMGFGDNVGAIFEAWRDFREEELLGKGKM